METCNMTDKVRQITDFIKNVGMPGALAFALLGVLTWQLYVVNQMQAQTLTVIQAHTAAVEINTEAVKALREEVRRDR